MFFAGPNVATYRVRAAGGSAVGLRCVKFANLRDRAGVPGVSFVWFGEGHLDGQPYRHFGEAFQGQIQGQGQDGLHGHAAYLHGNGEQLQGHVEGLTFQVAPGTITVRGAWEEVWDLEPAGLIHEYTSTLAPITRAGPWFDDYTVRDKGGTSGEGHRFMLASGSWLGAGVWRGVPYLHLGAFVGDPAAAGLPIAFGASDICHDRGFCSEVPWGIILLRPAPRYGQQALEIVGDWTEVWTLGQRRISCACIGVPRLPFLPHPTPEA